METSEQLLASRSSPFPSISNFGVHMKIKFPRIDWSLKEEIESLLNLFKRILEDKMKLNKESEKKLIDDAKALVNRLNDLPNKNTMRPSYDISIPTIIALINRIRSFLFYIIENKLPTTHDVRNNMMYQILESVKDLESLDLSDASAEGGLINLSLIF